MEITKVFSDMYGEERFYNVLMSESEMALFSIFSSEIVQSKNVDSRDMLKRAIKPSLKGVKYIKEDGSPDRMKNFKQGMIDSLMWG